MSEKPTLEETLPPIKPPLGPMVSATSTQGEVSVAVAVQPAADGSNVVTARKAGGLRDLHLQVNPDVIGLKGALQHMAKAVNIAFQTDFGENELESMYQAAVVLRGEVRIIHKDYFGFRDTWFAQFGRLLRSLKLSLTGADPASPEGRQQIEDHGASTIRGLLSLVGRKLDIVPEYEDRVPAFVEQMFDRLEASGILTGWDREDWEISTTSVGLDIRIKPRAPEAPPTE